MSQVPQAIPQALLLDLDGTLVDTLSFLFDAFRFAVQPFVSHLPRNEEVVATFGPAEPECILRYLRQAEAAGQATTAPDLAADEAAQRFFSFYENGGDDVRAFPGMLDLIRDLQAAGRPVGIFTGKGRRGAEYTLHRLGLWPDGIQILVSSDDVRFAKPHPEGILKVLAALKIDKDQLLFVGDAPADIIAGRAAGVRTAAALWGAFDRAATLHEGPTVALDSVAELRQLLWQPAL